MACLLSSNGHNSACFDDIHLKLSENSYFQVYFHPMLSKYINSKTIFFDVITNELYWLIIITYLATSLITTCFYSVCKKKQRQTTSERY